MLRGKLPRPLLAGIHITIGEVATDAQLTKVQANRLATVAHDGLARAINPVHTMSDGDTLFARAVGRSTRTAQPDRGRYHKDMNSYSLPRPRAYH